MGTASPLAADRTVVGDVALLNAREHVDRFADLIVRASSDAAFRNTSVPSATVRKDVVDWLTANPDWTVQLVVVGTEDVGYVALHPPILTEEAEAYADCLETETYVLPRWQRKGVASAAWALVLPTLPPSSRLVAELWADNAPARQRLEKEGWQPAGTHWWQHPSREEINGLCLRYVRTV